MEQSLNLSEEIQRVLFEFLDRIISVIPSFMTGILFLIFAYLIIRGIRFVSRHILVRMYGEGEHLIIKLWMNILTVSLWFGAFLILFQVLGMNELAASLGTATGFVALGVAFALKDMISDFVAGIYLIQDPDFTAGSHVIVGDSEGKVTSVGLRKSRLETGNGDVVVLANSTVEQKWTRKSN